MIQRPPLSIALDAQKTREAKWLSWGFLLVLGVVAVDMIARNVGPWTVQYGALWDFYVVWEASSIAFTIVLTIVHWMKYLNKRQGAFGDVLQTKNQVFAVGLLIGLSALALIIAGLVAICIGVCRDVESFAITEMLVVEAMCLTLGVVFIVIAEITVIKAVPQAKLIADDGIRELKVVLASAQTAGPARNLIETQLGDCEEKRAAYDDILDDVGKFLAFSDAPIAGAFLIISLVVCTHWFGWTGADNYLLPPFIAGAVALQLLYSNCVFYIEANGSFPKWARWLVPALDEVKPMIQGRLGDTSTRDTN